MLAQLTRIKESVSQAEKLRGEVESVRELALLSTAQEEETLASELAADLARLEEEVERLELATLLSGPHDHDDCIFSIQAGAGGTDSCDWAAMLHRMYRYAFEHMGLEAQEVDRSEGEEAGIKSVTFFVRGRYAYGLLKAEKGIHRLVRISPFDANKRRHTSFAAVDVVPDLEETQVEIAPEELRIDVFRASGAGGQHVNKSSTAVRIVHIPTGITVQCQSERSQYRNKTAAMKVLKGKLFALMEEQKKEEVAQLRGEVKDAAWGNQIRSYILHPYQMVKDHRTNLEVAQVDRVLDGHIQPFIQSYLEWQAARPAQRG